MRKTLFASVVLVLLAIFFVACDSTTRVAPPNLTSSFTFIRASGGGTLSASVPRQFSTWSVRARGHEMTKLHQGSGLAPWALTIDPGTDSVVLMKNDGTGEKVLANQAGWFDSVQLASTGNKAVFSAEVTGKAQIFTATLDNLNNIVIKQLTTDNENHGWPQLSTDGKKIVAMKYVGNVVQGMVMDITGGTETTISTPNYWVLAPTFTPDGKVMFGDDNTGKIMVMNIDGTGMTSITTPADTEWDGFPAMSNDGKTVIFNRNGDIFSQAMDGTGLKQLTTDGMSWDPLFVKNKVVFISYRDAAGGGEIYSMSLDGTAQTRLTTNNVDEYFVYD